MAKMPMPKEAKPPKKATPIVNLKSEKPTRKVVKAEAIGDQIDRLHALREEHRAINKLAEAKEEEIKALKAVLLERLDKEKTDRAASRRASINVSEVTLTNITDFEAFMKFITENGHFHLVERRAARLACQELWTRGESIPGVSPFVKRDINLNTLNK